MTNLNEMLSKMTEFLKSEAKTDTIIGQQFLLGEFACVPVMSIGLGFGGGGGEDGKNTDAATEGAGSGGGAGMGMSPIGFLVTKNDNIQFIPTNSSKGLGAMFEKIPDLMERYLDKNKINKKEGASI